MLRHALYCVQQRKLQPATAELGSRAWAVQMLLQERKSSLQTLTLWLPWPQGEGDALRDWAGESVCAQSCGAAAAKRSPRINNATLRMR